MAVAKMNDAPSTVPFFIYSSRVVAQLPPVDARQNEEMGIGSRTMPNVEMVAPNGTVQIVCEGEVHAWERKGWRRQRRPTAAEAQGKVPYGQVDWSRYSDDDLLEFCQEANAKGGDFMKREQRIDLLRRIGFTPKDASVGGASVVISTIPVAPGSTAGTKSESGSGGALRSGTQPETGGESGDADRGGDGAEGAASKQEQAGSGGGQRRGGGK